MPRAYASPEIVDGKTVKDLVDARAIRGAVILGRPGGWSIVVRYGAVERSVAAQRSDHPRLWRNLNTAVAFVRDELGISRFEVDTAGYDPDAVERKRPDQTERLRRQHEAATHDAWFRGQVEATLDGIANGVVGFVSDEDHRARWQRKRAELAARTGKAK